MKARPGPVSWGTRISAPRSCAYNRSQAIGSRPAAAGRIVDRYDQVVCSLLFADALEIQHAGEPVTVEPDGPVIAAAHEAASTEAAGVTLGREPARRAMIRESG